MDLPETGLVFHPDQYVYGVWLVPCNPATPMEDQEDWLCCLWRELDRDLWFVRYRFRYVSDPDPWSGHDRRSWSTLTKEDSTPVETVASDVHALANVVSWRIGMPVQFLAIGGDGAKALTLMEQQSWVQMKEVPL